MAESKTRVPTGEIRIAFSRLPHMRRADAEQNARSVVNLPFIGAEIGDRIVIIVVSNRVARVSADEPMTCGLASALLPVVKESGAVWVGSSGRVREISRKDSFAEIEALGTGALATVDL